MIHQQDGEYWRRNMDLNEMDIYRFFKTKKEYVTFVKKLQKILGLEGTLQSTTTIRQDASGVSYALHVTITSLGDYSETTLQKLVDFLNI